MKIEQTESIGSLSVSVDVTLDCCSEDVTEPEGKTFNLHVDVLVDSLTYAHDIWVLIYKFPMLASNTKYLTLFI